MLILIQDMLISPGGELVCVIEWIYKQTYIYKQVLCDIFVVQLVFRLGFISITIISVLEKHMLYSYLSNT